MSKGKHKVNLDNTQARRKSSRISDICSRSTVLCKTPTPNRTLNVSNQHFCKSSSQNSSPPVEPIIAQIQLRRKSLRILNQSMSNASETKDRKQVSNMSQKLQRRHDLFKRQITSYVDNHSKFERLSITSTSSGDKDLTHCKKMEMVENKENCKKGHILQNKVHQAKCCSISQQNNTDPCVLSGLELSIQEIKRMSNEEILSMKKSKTLFEVERVALKKRNRVLQFSNSVRATCPPRTSLSLPSSPTIEPISSVRKHSLQLNHESEFIPINFTRESQSERLYHQSPSKFKSKVEQVPKQKTAKIKVSKLTKPARKSKQKCKQRNAKQDTAITSQESGNSLKLARVGTLKRKRQIRKILATHNSTQTLLDSTPMRSIKSRKIPFVDAMSPMSFGTPAAPKPKRTKKSPRIFTPTNRANQDRYIKELERRNKNNIDRPITEIWGDSSQMNMCEDVNKGDLSMLCPPIIYDNDNDVMLPGSHLIMSHDGDEAASDDYSSSFSETE